MVNVSCAHWCLNHLFAHVRVGQLTHCLHKTRDAYLYTSCRALTALRIASKCYFMIFLGLKQRQDSYAYELRVVQIMFTAVTVGFFLENLYQTVKSKKNNIVVTTSYRKVKGSWRVYVVLGRYSQFSSLVFCIFNLKIGL